MIRAIVELSCDDDGCDIAYSPSFTEIESVSLTRVGATIAGWTRADGMDQCPAHAREDHRAARVRELVGRRMTDGQIGVRLRRLADAATPEPWHSDDDGLVWGPTLGDPVSSSTEITDAEFIAAARTAVPALLDEVQRLTGLLAAANLRSPTRPDIAAALTALTEGVLAIQLMLSQPHYGPVRVTNGRRTRWVTDPLSGGMVCAERTPDGECGQSVELGPCEVHHPHRVDRPTPEHTIPETDVP